MTHFCLQSGDYVLIDCSCAKTKTKTKPRTKVFVLDNPCDERTKPLVLHTSLCKYENKKYSHNHNFFIFQFFSSPDARAIESVLQQLAAHKEDNQQRNWALHEDEHIIESALRRLLDLLHSRYAWSRHSLIFYTTI